MKIDTNAVWEFFSPFAHIPGRYEWCRIHSPTHGSFDTFIVIRESTDRPPVVYVNSPEGQRFMAERYPESSCFMVKKEKLRIRSADDGATVEGRLEADEGPISRAQMRLAADPSAVPEALPYGNADFAVWGSRWACEGVDLERQGRCTGRLLHADGTEEIFTEEPCTVTAGSFARITHRPASPESFT